MLLFGFGLSHVSLKVHIQCSGDSFSLLIQVESDAGPIPLMLHLSSRELTVTVHYSILIFFHKYLKDIIVQTYDG